MFEDTTPLVEGLSIDEAFLDVAWPASGSPGTPTEIAARLRREVRDRVGLPITVGVARTKFLAKVASGGRQAGRPARRAARRRARLPAPAPGRAALGRRADDRRASCASAGSAPSARSPSSPRTALVAMLGRASGRHLHALAHNRDPRPVRTGRRAGSIGSQRALGRRGAAAARRSTRRSSRWSTASPGGCARPAASAARSCSACASTTSRARPGRTRCRARRRETDVDPARARALLDAAAPLIEHPWAHADRGRGREPRRRRERCSLSCRSTRAAAVRSMLALDEIRERFGTSAITRAVLLGRRRHPRDAAPARLSISASRRARARPADRTSPSTGRCMATPWRNVRCPRVASRSAALRRARLTPTSSRRGAS